jgi:hypothetical protein
VAFIAITLQDLQDVINVKDVIEEYQKDANQRGIKKPFSIKTWRQALAAGIIAASFSRCNIRRST